LKCGIIEERKGLKGSRKGPGQRNSDSKKESAHSGRENGGDSSPKKADAGMALRLKRGKEGDQ